MFPIVKSHAAAQPLIKVSDIAKRDSDDIVVHCSAKVGLQVGDDFHGRVTSRSFRQSPYFSFDLPLAFLSPADFPVNDGEAEKARFLERNDFAFGLIRLISLLLTPWMSTLLVKLTGGEEQLDKVVLSGLKENLLQQVNREATTVSFTSRFTTLNHMEFSILFPLAVPVLAIAVSVQVRLFDGYGYTESIYLTLTERHIASYLNEMRLHPMNIVNLIWYVL